jgi:hypothetical protein
MSAIIINTKEKKGLKLLTELAKQLGYSVKVLSNEELEDVAFGEYLDNVKTGQTVSREEVMKKLRS